MFTGIIEELGVVGKIETSREPRLFSIKAKMIAEDLKKGDSVSVNGACLTVVDVKKGSFSVEAIEETLKRTSLGDLRPADKVNLEGALKAGAKISGHFMTGHVDGLASVIAREDMTDMARFHFRAPHALARFIAPKGSVALDGVSLTVNTVEGDTFSVLIIPHTLQVTTFGALATGCDVNLEIDTMARYAARLMDSK